MQSFFELFCNECNNTFTSAASLLKHFAQHATETPTPNEQMNRKMRKSKIPDLYPIGDLKREKLSSEESKTDEENVDSGFEDLVSPLKFCLVTMNAIKEEATPNDKVKSKNGSKKFECNYCSKSFGWSTDLKRHILIHTGERPFRCFECESTFTRKFLLQKHQNKQHCKFTGRNELPPLKPIGSMSKQRSRKQEKSNIKRNDAIAKNVSQSENHEFKVNYNLICSS